MTPLILRMVIAYCLMSLCLATTALASESVSTNTSQEQIVPSPETILQRGISVLTEQFKQSGTPQAKLEFLNKEIAPYFDFTYMARLAAGYYWNQLNAEQRHTFQEYFKGTFFQALARQISNFGNPRIQFYPARPSTNANEITVSASVAQPQGMPILIDFRFYHGDQGWKMFDVVADGSSAVLYYRRFYANLVTRYGINGLLRPENKQ